MGLGQRRNKVAQIAIVGISDQLANMLTSDFFGDYVAVLANACFYVCLFFLLRLFPITNHMRGMFGVILKEIFHVTQLIEASKMSF